VVACQGQSNLSRGGVYNLFCDERSIGSRGMMPIWLHKEETWPYPKLESVCACTNERVINVDGLAS